MSIVVYEVNVQVDTDCLQEWLEFMNTHIAQLLDLPAFLSAEVQIAEVDEATPGPEGKTLVVSVYRVKSRAALQLYFDNEAVAMRADTMRLFGTRITATRRILQVHKQYN